MSASRDAEKPCTNPGRGFLYSLCQSQLISLERTTDAIERKASTILGFVAVFLALILENLAPNPKSAVDVSLTYTTLLFLLGGAVRAIRLRIIVIAP